VNQSVNAKKCVLALIRGCRGGVVFLLLALGGCQSLPIAADSPWGGKGADPAKSVIRVNVTRQGHNWHRPWQLQAPATQTAIGAVIAGPNVLVTASLVADQRYIELENIQTGVKTSAAVAVVDYEVNLALLQPSDPSVLAGAQPLGITTDPIKGDALSVWQVHPNGAVTPARAVITAIELGPYNIENHFLVFRLDGALQYRFNNLTLPVVKDGKLAGLLMRSETERQTIDVIAPPVIAHFLEDVADGAYRGFPVSGIGLSSTEDPQLRRYAGIEAMTGGVFVETVRPQSAADKAGIRDGDILFKVGGYAIDSRGHFDHPRYGKLGLAHMLRCMFHAGDRVVHEIWRSGQMLAVDVVLESLPSEAFRVPPFIIDRPPRYLILGGLVLQELSGPYLRSFGKDWMIKAPAHLVYLEKKQDGLPADGSQRIVFLSEVLPTAYTVGYENLSHLVVTSINDQPLLSLDEIPAALEKPVNGFHKIAFAQRPHVLFIDPAELPLINRQLQERYNLPVLRNLDR
jgi:hypothetical protein